MKSLFIADLHLKVSCETNDYNEFKMFLDRVSDEIDNLYILGDFFTYWYEHPNVDFASKNPALQALKKFKQKGKKVFLIYGNRDFTAGKDFQAASDVDYIGESLELDQEGLKLFLHHGDIFAKKDIRYAIWRRFIRSKAASWVFKNLPVSYAINIADKFSKIGHKRPSQEYYLAERMFEKALGKLKSGYDALILGHAHIEAIQEHNINGKVAKIIILPEFHFPGRALFLENGKLEFKTIAKF